jgi:hypothetical protein
MPTGGFMPPLWVTGYLVTEVLALLKTKMEREGIDAQM